MENSLSKSRLAVSTGFFVTGAVYGMIACRIPDLQRQVRLDDGQLGLALLFGSAGAMLGVANAGRLCARKGSHVIMIAIGIAFCCLVALLGTTFSFWQMASVCLCFGFCGGTMDVAMNINGVAVEKLHERPIMSSLHGMFSLGGLASAAVGWLIVRSSVPFQFHFLGGAVVCVLLLLAIKRYVLPSTPDPDHVPPSFVMPEKAVLTIGVICLCAFHCEGAMGDWSAIYLQKVLHETPSVSTLGYFGFALTMTTTRFFGDAVLHRFGPTVTLRWSGLVTAVGLGLAILFPITWLTIIGFSCVGLGMAIVAPIAFSVGGRLGGDNPDHAIASVATMGYGAFLIGPALIGFIAKTSSLREAMILVVVLSVVIVLLAGAAEKA